MSWVLICISSQIALLSTVIALPVFSPEDAVFALHRCQNDSTSNSTLRILWRSWRLPNDQETHCYVKCFLNKLGLIILKHRGLDGEKICDHFQISGSNRQRLEEWLSLPLDGTCISYYNKWILLQHDLLDEIRKGFYTDEQDRVEFSKFYPYRSKMLGATAIDYCTMLDPFSWFDKEFKCNFFCIFKHFHYFGAYGRIDGNEIIRSFVEAEKNVKVHWKNVMRCVHRANSLFSYGPCDMAFELKVCLLNEIKNILYIFEYRNEMTKFY